MTLRSVLLYLLPFSGTALAFQPLPVTLQTLESAPRGSTCDPSGLCLQVSVGLTDPTNPQTCPDTRTISTDVGQSLTWCYTLTNNSGRTLNWHSLSDSLHGTVFTQLNRPLPAGSSYQHVRVRSAGSVHDGSVEISWTASTDRPSYQHDDSTTFDYIDATDGEVLEMVGGFNGTRTAPLVLPFDFTFFGVTGRQLCVGHNGAVEFGVGGCVLPYVFGMPSLYGIAVIAPAWTELLNGTGTVYTKTIGDPGQRKQVIQWTDMVLAWPNTVPGVDFQLILDEASGAMIFQYLSMGSAGGNGDRSVVGLQSDPLNALVYSSFQPKLPPAHAIRWTPQLPDSSSATASVQVDIGAPRLLLPIPQLTAFTGVGTISNQPLIVINTGNRTLNWQAGEYPVRHLPISAPALASRPSTRTAQPRRATAAAPVATIPSPRAAAGVPLVPVSGLERIQGSQRDYVRLNLLDAGSPVTVLGEFDQLMSASGMEFVGNDFSRQWVIDWRSNQVQTLDPATGAARPVGRAQPRGTVPGEGWMGIAWDPADDHLYGVTVSASCGWSGLYRIDQDNATASFVGPIVTGANVCITDIAFDQNGQLYGIDISEDALVIIDKHSGISQLVGNLGVNAEFEQGLKFDRASGTLYWTAFVDQQGAIARIDPLTGVPTVLGPTHQLRQLVPFSIATSGGDCTQPTDVPWLRMNLSEGQLAPGSAPTFIDVSFDGTAVAAGVYNAHLCVFSNDPAYRVAPLSVPVQLTVIAETPVFVDGFED